MPKSPQSRNKNMDLDQIPKKYVLALIAGLVVVLVAITIIQPGRLAFKSETDYDALLKQQQEDEVAYSNYLASIEPNYEASKQLLQKIATEDVVREQVDLALQTKQKVVIPTISDSEINVSSRSDRPAVINYFTTVASVLDNYVAQIEPSLPSVYGLNSAPDAAASAASATVNFANQLRGISVPSEALNFHKATLVAYNQYASFLNTGKDYAQGINSEPWSTVYRDYTIMDNRIGVERTEYNKLNQKYAINDALREFYADQYTGSIFAKTAQAQFGNVTIGDLPRWIEYGIRSGLATAFASFSIKMLDNVIAHIEKTFAIASQLYYSEELGRFYSLEYMEKFVDDPLDQDIIKNFLPEYFCIPKNKEQLRHIFDTKAAQNIGSGVAIDINNPKYFELLGQSLGDEKSQSPWWEQYFTDLAAQTQTESQKAAINEVTSPGNKSGRNIISGKIDKTMASIFNVQQASINGAINLGASNAENLASQIVSTLIQSLVNRFVFTPVGGGTTGPGGGLGVLQEQNVCLKTPVTKPVTPVASTDPVPAPPPPPTR
jgi:hypothetical protein